MDVGVHNGLAGGLSHVHTHVIPVRMQNGVLAPHGTARTSSNAALRSPLGQLEEVANVAERGRNSIWWPLLTGYRS